MKPIHGACIALTCRMLDYKLGVLVGYRSSTNKYWPDHLQLPGGKVNIETEGSRVGLLRELDEETGLSVDILDHLGNMDCFFPDGTIYDLALYTSHFIGHPYELLRTVQNREPTKNVKWELRSVEELVQNHPANMLPGMYEVLCQL